MAGRVIQALRHSKLVPSLTEAELRVLANCGRIESFKPGETVIAAGGPDERLFVFLEGEVRLVISMWSEGGHCGGEAAFDLTTPGEAFGWAMWVRSDRITVAATARKTTTLVALDLNRLGDATTLLKVSQRMVQLLYGRLQEGGVCPPDVQGLLKLQHFLHA
jgi:CRP-like cAMP-binding protein